MSGFPTRPDRDSFGPTYENERPVNNPKRELGDSVFNLNFWQLAGSGLVIPRAMIVASVSGSAVTTQNQGLAWDPNGNVSNLIWTYEGVGHYSADFLSQYVDENGTLVNLSLIAGAAFPQGTAARFGTVNLTSGYEFDVYFFTDAGVAVDPGSFLILLW